MMLRHPINKVIKLLNEASDLQEYFPSQPENEMNVGEHYILAAQIETL